MQVNAPSYGDVEGLVQKAYLMIPSTPPPFVNVVNMSLVRTYMYHTSPGFEIEAKILPSNATNQTVKWAIRKWTDGVTTIELPKLDPFDEGSVADYNAKKLALLEKIGYLQEEYVYDDSVYPVEKRLRDVPGIFIVPKASGTLSKGTVTVQAVIKEGKQVAGKFQDFENSYTFQIRDPLPLTFKFLKKSNGTLDTTMGTSGLQTTDEWGAIDNGGVKGGYMEVLSASNTTPPPVGTYDTYTITLGGGYGNSHHYFKVDLGSKKLSDLQGIKAHYKAGDGDSNLVGKTIRLRGSTTIPSRTYSQAGPYVATLAFPGGADVKDTELEFEFFIDKGNVFDTVDKTGTKPMPTPNQTINGETVPFKPVQDASIVYLWFVPWSTEKGGGKQTTFEISDIRLITKN